MDIGDRPRIPAAGPANLVHQVDARPEIAAIARFAVGCEIIDKLENRTIARGLILLGDVEAIQGVVGGTTDSADDLGGDG